MRRDLKVGLFVNSAWNLLNFRRELMTALHDEGCELHLIVPEGVKELHAYGCIHELPMNPGGMRFLEEARTVWRLRSLLARLRLDFLLTFTIKPNLYGALLGDGRNLKVICNITGLGEVFHSNGVRQWVVRPVYKAAMRRAHTVFVQNGDDAKLLVSGRLVAEEKVRRIPGSGVDTEHYQPTCMAMMRTSSPVQFLFVGRFRSDKGFLDYVEAARLVKARGVAARFTAVGQVESGRHYSINREFLRQIADEGIVEIIDFVEDIRPLVGASDCVVLPSYREGLPRSLLEAASMEKPVIASDVPGCREALLDGVTGLLCRVRDCSDLARVMCDFCSMGPAERILMGRRGRKFVEEFFSVGHVICAYKYELGLHAAGS